jgi:hemerythrin-like domain-containing protein
MDTAHASQMLVEVRKDHELVAEQLRILQALEGTIVGTENRRLTRTLELLRGASRMFQDRLLPHFDQEEHELFPLFRECLPKGSTLLYELQADHEQIRRLCERLRAELSWLRHAKHRRAPLLGDLQSLCVHIAGLLNRHAEREQQLVNRLVGFQTPSATSLVETS